jgi:predicted component of type VI protein secretion system
MLVLRLFHQSDPFQQIETRALAAGEVTIGRDAEADWVLADPNRAISRTHCVLELGDGRLTVRDLSANGIFVGADRIRPAAGVAHPLAVGESVRLGDYLILVETAASPDAGPIAEESASAAADAAAQAAFDAPFSRPMLQVQPITGETLAVPTEWKAGPAAVRTTPSDGSLLDAFCAGARLDSSAFAGDEPAEVMRRLGAVYQQMVLGLSDLMGERTSVKTEYRMTRTTVRAEGNNPFKWAPAERVAVDLLRSRDDAFLSGPAPVKASFEDMKKHLLCMLAGQRAALASTLDNLSPKRVEAELKGQSFVLKNKAAAAWEEYVRLYGELRQRADDDADSPINREFRAAYERLLQDLDSLGARPQ